MAVQSLTDAQKNRIYAKHRGGGVSKATLAKEYGVSARTIGRVLDEVGDQSLDNNAWSPKNAVSNTITASIDDDWYDFDLEDDGWFDFDLEDDDCVSEEDLVEAPNYKYTVVANNSSISVTRVDGEGGYVDTVSIDYTHPNFQKCLSLLRQGFDDEILEAVFAMVDVKAFLEKVTQGSVTVDPIANKVYHNSNGVNCEFHGRLVPRLLEAAKDCNAASTKALFNFANRLAQTPSNRIHNELYDFLEASDIKIDEDGRVICWKRVRHDFTDIHSGEFDNSPGTRPSVPRNMVDEDSNQTCSYGLHVCSQAYLPSFHSGGNSRTIKVAVNPEDFVSIPHEYYSNSGGQVKAKARVCAYEVLEEVVS